MRRALVLVALAGCNPHPPAPASPVASPQRLGPPIDGTPIDLAGRFELGRVAAIDITNQHQQTNHYALWIDEAGTAAVSHTTLFTSDPKGRVGLPFSQPVEDVVFVAHVAERVAPGAQGGIAYCARTRAATLECVTDFLKIELDGRRVRVAAYRFTPPVEGRVTHVGPAWPSNQVCAATTASAACWAFSHDGKRMTPVPGGGAAAIAVATKLPAEVAMRWKAADPDVSLERIRKLAVSSSLDDRHILAPGENPAVWCAVLDSGVLSCFGPGVFGELGDGTLAVRPRASRPFGATRVLDVSISNRGICAVVDGGRLACWGHLPVELPLARGVKPALLPMCTLDCAAGASRFSEARQRDLARFESCRTGCRANPVRDCFLNCSRRCNAEPYLFRHDTVCQEPTTHSLEQAVRSRLGDPCRAAVEREPRWLTDSELADLASPTELLLAPAYVRGIDDAMRLAVWGPRVCVLRRTGAVTCVD